MDNIKFNIICNKNKYSNLTNADIFSRNRDLTFQKISTHLKKQLAKTFVWSTVRYITNRKGVEAFKMWLLWREVKNKLGGQRNKYSRAGKRELEKYSNHVCTEE